MNGVARVKFVSIEGEFDDADQLVSVVRAVFSPPAPAQQPAAIPPPPESRQLAAPRAPSRVATPSKSRASLDAAIPPENLPQAVIQILRDAPDGLRPVEIKSQITTRYGDRWAVAGVDQALFYLKTRGLVNKSDDKLWRLVL